MLGARLALRRIQPGHMLQALGQLSGIPKREQHAHTFNHLEGSTTRRGEQRYAGNHRLQQNHAERLMVGAQGEHVERLEIAPRIGHLAQKIHLTGNTQLRRLRFERSFQAALSQDRQTGASWQIG